MSSPRNIPRFGFVFAPAVLLAALGLTIHAQPPEPGKPPDTRPGPKDPPAVKLPDGTFLWLGTPPDGNGERVTLTAQELQKLLDQVDQLKKQLAARKATTPSGCAVSGKIQKRGEQPVAVLKLTCTFRTTLPQSAVLLGGRKGFLVKASLDNNQLPVIETTEDGFVALIEAPGNHSLTLELEVPVTARGAKPELGFELGLPRAAITTLLFEPPGPDVSRVNLTTRTLDSSRPLRPPEVRRVPALEIAQLTATPEHEAGYPLGPVDSLELTWEPTAVSTQSAEQVQSAELNITVLLTEGVVETTAKIALRGPAREWRLVAPPLADLSVDRAPGTNDSGPTLPPSIARPIDHNKPVWKIDFPTGVSAADWIVTVVTRQPRPKPEDVKHRGPFPVGPFTVLDVMRQTGTVRVTTVANTRLVFKHGPDLRRDVLPGPPEEDVPTASFRLTTGPTGTVPLNNPPALLTVQAMPLTGSLRVKPVYRLTQTDTGWRVRAELKITPVHTEVDAVTIEIPAEWRGLEASPPELVDGIQPGTLGGFWQTAPLRLAGAQRTPVVVRLSDGHRQPFDLVLTASVPFPPGATEASVPFPRFPGAFEPETTVTATVTEGLEVRGEARGWDGDFIATSGTPLVPVNGASGKGTKAVTVVTAKSDIGISRVLLGWNPHRPDMTAELRADVTVLDRQVAVNQVIRLRSPDGFPRGVRLRGPNAAGLKSQPPLDSLGPGEWGLGPLAEAKEVTITLNYAIHTGRAADEHGPWRVPLTLIWPVGPPRTEATIRVWSNTVIPRTLTNLSSNWRELPIEPVADRNALPAIVLAANGGEVPLVLEAHEVVAPSAVTAWVDRSLIQTWATDSATTSYRARFRLRQWLTPAIEVRLPGPLVGASPEFFRDDEKVEALPLGEPGRFRIPLPEARPERTTAIEVRYQMTATRSMFGETTYFPPQLPTAAFVGPVRWQVTVTSGAVPLLTGGATAELVWRGGRGRLAPAASSADELERWFRAGTELGDEPDNVAGESLTAFQSVPAAMTVYRVPRVGLVIVASVTAFVLILAQSRLRAGAVGLVMALLGCAIALVAVFFPQPTAQIAAAAQPGVAVALLVLLIQIATYWHYRRRVTHLPGFARGRAEPVAAPSPVPSSARNRPSAAGAPGTTPVPAAGS